ncbi:polyphosphate kinase [Clostridium pasteurianum DSM 525 = ATCC 6013]|uniref:Polyphosphate kinase n=1 Tax=Clostridium pasteurianum DSM 525 = ATCC 6013 TaxID=1262449 RepID=A0A0H3J6V9_CLOPA|nr:RNA degradosome polyphosphate kinase [Clostridium pasteurianum]AJA47653.1 polyphosphate kinase [Clostridium pasteurianum DSM 525 = ATCC 6013]AJA51641.1 polyphosphate kinase [Clostridium pasteurianum DSM 525 = ATCC 6013]AOZ74960.1 polyphosphate kinase [Clostridium pasteurianum DSM 525 = ATCC 6013]AOZ78755.1 polyphosphate kinase [Clostridium pasteurianum]ELP58008.1 polyphosphate kinase [Clostridium pasteurianum DSM 525 = ATCC 6013]
MEYKYENFINRELSWLEFNKRVLEEAGDKNNPLLERLKFLSIVSSNLDEFFMIRVASLIEQVQANFKKVDFSGLTSSEQVKKITEKVHDMVHNQYDIYKSLKSELKNEKIFLLKPKDINTDQREFINSYFHSKIYPVLTPMVVDNSRPFPLILNKSLNIALFIDGKEEENIFATVQVPSVLGRIVELPKCDDEQCFILLEDIIKIHINDIFIGHNIKAMGCYRITRNADLSIDEEGAEDLLEAIQQSVKNRKWGEAIRIEIEHGMDERLVNLLNKELEASFGEIYHIKGPIDLTFLFKLGSIKGYENLKYSNFNSVPVPEFMSTENIFDAISKQDILVHHPYQSFQYVVDLVKIAAKDPKVLAIKQTLYRVSGNSPIVKALMEAAENGKQVTVLVELKARFDEENNIIWARRLEKAGCHVIYGLVGLKTHGKILLIVRNEDDGIKRYVHMGTGNYNDVTANFYTDMGLFTSNPYIGEDASSLFNMLSGYSMINELNKLYIAPSGLRKKFISLIKREENNAREGKNAHIIAKINSLVDKEIIEALYDASKAGVKIQLIVRGICCLKPGLKGVSENITVISIVGRFLEHSRIFYFYNNSNEEIYLSSADWMNRNLDRRVEILFPIEDMENKHRIKQFLNIYLSDNVKARILNSDGTYSRINYNGNEDMINSQEYFSKKAIKQIKKAKKKENQQKFTPITSIKK